MLIISKPKKIDEVVAKFVIKTLPTISGETEYEYLNEMIQALYANAATVPTTLSGGKHDHVELIINETLYTTLEMRTPWEDPDDPGKIPTIATNVTVAHRQQANETHSEARRILENAATMDEALKTQIIETIEYTYTTELCNKYTGFMGVNNIDMFCHIMYRYEKITETDLKENYKRLDEALDTTMPIEKCFEKLMTAYIMHMITRSHIQRLR